MAGGGSSEENPVAINVVAMVDIIFCLCLFFMCSLKFKPLDAKFESWLPKNKGARASANVNPILDEIRILLSWNKEANKLERIFGQNRGISSDETGDKLLLSLIKESYQDYKARGNPDVPVIIDSGQLVPWSMVVKVMDIAKDAGVQKIEFGQGSALN